MIKFARFHLISFQYSGSIEEGVEFDLLLKFMIKANMKIHDSDGLAALVAKSTVFLVCFT